MGKLVLFLRHFPRLHFELRVSLHEVFWLAVFQMEPVAGPRYAQPILAGLLRSLTHDLATRVRHGTHRAASTAVARDAWLGGLLLQGLAFALFLRWTFLTNQSEYVLFTPTGRSLTMLRWFHRRLELLFLRHCWLILLNISLGTVPVYGHSRLAVLMVHHWWTLLHGWDVLATAQFHLHLLRLGHFSAGKRCPRQSNLMYHLTGLFKFIFLRRHGTRRSHVLDGFNFLHLLWLLILVTLSLELSICDLILHVVWRQNFLFGCSSAEDLTHLV